jgi:hypothetical protein
MHPNNEREEPSHAVFIPNLSDGRRRRCLWVGWAPPPWFLGLHYRPHIAYLGILLPRVYGVDCFCKRSTAVLPDAANINPDVLISVTSRPFAASLDLGIAFHACMSIPMWLEDRRILGRSVRKMHATEDDLKKRSESKCWTDRCVATTDPPLARVGHQPLMDGKTNCCRLSQSAR